MPTIAILLAASLVTVIAVIGLADALTHLVGWAMRMLKEADGGRASGAQIDARGGELTA